MFSNEPDYVNKLNHMAKNGLLGPIESVSYVGKFERNVSNLDLQIPSKTIIKKRSINKWVVFKNWMVSNKDLLLAIGALFTMLCGGIKGVFWLISSLN